jgi:hypothetical protein
MTIIWAPTTPILAVSVILPETISWVLEEGCICAWAKPMQRKAKRVKSLNFI